METNNKFDDLLRSSLYPQKGLSGWFTHRVMMQIEQQNSIVQQKNLSRIGLLIAICSVVVSAVLCLLFYMSRQDSSGLMYLLWYFKTYVVAVLGGWLTPIYYTMCSISPTHLLAIVIGVSALVCWDMALGNRGKHHA